ncbi:MAG TPA: SIMPL domain-containing protein [Solirubrobacterales bacterium]
MARIRATALGALGLALALALVAPAAGLAASGRTVSVHASATLQVPNDTARVGLGVSRERRSRGAALRAASAGLRKVVAAVQAVPGVGPGDVHTGRVSLRRVQKGTTALYRAGEGIGVTLHQPERAGELVQAAIAAGASGVNGPSYFVGDSEAAYAKALAAAFDLAKARATTLASEAGATLGPAISIVEGGAEHVFPPTGAENEVGSAPKGAPPPPTKPGTSTVTAEVSVVFELL